MCCILFKMYNSALRFAQDKLCKNSYIVALCLANYTLHTNKRGKLLREFQRLLVLFPFDKLRMWPNNKQIRLHKNKR
jgi:hypothetical protein